MTATAGPDTAPEPFPDSWLLRSPSIRLIPVGSVWAIAWTSRSAETKATRGSAFSAASRASGMVAA